MAVLGRLRFDPRTSAYAERRTHEGLSKPEIIRCLKALHRPRDLQRATHADRREPFHAPTCKTIGASTRLRAAGGVQDGNQH